jgi:hypothetical protein
MIVSIVFLPKGLVGTIGEIREKRRKAALLGITAGFMLIGWGFTQILEKTGTSIGGLVFPLLFGIAGFVIFANVFRHIEGKGAA